MKTLDNQNFTLITITEKEFVRKVATRSFLTTLKEVQYEKINQSYQKSLILYLWKRELLVNTPR